LQFQLQTLLEGNVIGSILELDKAVPIRMIYPNTQNRNLEEKKDFYLYQMENRFLSLI
jgi:hypothetical protein